MIDEIYNRSETENTIRSGIIEMLNKNRQLVMFVKAFNFYDKVIEYVPRIIVIISENPEGLQILKELGLDETVTNLRKG